jgi:predicted dithiol-disulfide oxidoreductase (DUF899 family)
MLQAYKRRMGWTLPWASSLGGDFNLDFNVSFTEEQQREGVIEYNYRRGGFVMDVKPVPKPVAEFAAMSGTDAATYSRERPGMSAFVLDDGVVYHTYSAYARGLDGLWGMYQWLDRAPNGRNEKGVWWRRHDEYQPLPQTAGSCCHGAEARTETLATVASQRRGTPTTLVGPRRAAASVVGTTRRLLNFSWLVTAV